MKTQPKTNILLVDDNPNNLLALEAILESLGQNLVKATSGEEALKCLLEQDFAVILLDVQMPDMDGFETAKLIRSRPSNKNTPIIFITAFSQTENFVIQAYSLGALDYIVKPFSPEILKRKIVTLLEVFQANRDILIKNEALKEVNSDLKKQIIEYARIKTELAALFNQEIRTPITVIEGALNLLSNNLVNPQLDRGKLLMKMAADNSDRLVELANNILDLDCLQSDNLDLVKIPCNAADLVIQAADKIQERASKAQVNLCVYPEEIELEVDSDRIIQVLTKLLDNAIKFSPPRATVDLTVESKMEKQKRKNNSHPFPTILFTVKDQGQGIPSPELDNIFEELYQVDKSDSRPQQKTGLGLAICRSIVQKHGGRIWVETTLGEGSTFYFTLPKPVTHA